MSVSRDITGPSCCLILTQWWMCSVPSEKVVTYASLKYVMFLGESPEPLMAQARAWLASQITTKPLPGDLNHAVSDVS